MASATLSGCITAIVTPMDSRKEVDFEGLRSLVEFQGSAGVEGIVANGTTGESTTLTPRERSSIVRECQGRLAGSSALIAGTGSNSTEESLRATREAREAGATHALLVDPYYNGPSSLEMRREYYEPIAGAFPDLAFIPYVIPGRTGTRLEPPDLALLVDACPNVVAVKEATGSDEYARAVRALLREPFSIMSGDDGRTANLIADPGVRAQGVISVISNVFPRPLAEWVRALRAGAQLPPPLARQAGALAPLLSLVTVETQEKTAKGLVRVKARNPVPVKAIMNILGIPAGSCRPPLGRLTPAALRSVLDALRKAHGDCPELFDGIEATFDVSVADRLQSPRSWEGLAYVD